MDSIFSHKSELIKLDMSTVLDYKRLDIKYLLWYQHDIGYRRLDKIGYEHNLTHVQLLIDSDMNTILAMKDPLYRFVQV